MTRNNGNEIIAALDIGTSKILALVAEINEQRELKVIGCGIKPSSGLKKGVVVNIEATVSSIDQAIREAEEAAGCEIDLVFRRRRRHRQREIRRRRRQRQARQFIRG